MLIPTLPRPSPAQPSMVSNCDAFYFAKLGDTCDSIAFKYSITSSQFITWNPSVGFACTALWADNYVCVSIIGHTARTPTTTTAGPAATATVIDGTSYPLPAAPTSLGSTPKCRSWYTVKSGDTCNTIVDKFVISRSQLVLWNTFINTSCNNIWADYAVCVSSPVEFSY